MKKITRISAFILAFMIMLTPVSGLFGFEADAATGKWVCSWATSIVDSAISVADVSVQDIIPSKSTIRIELKVTTGGDKLRFKFSNEYGAAAITINEATVAKTFGAGEAAIKADTAKAITFNRSPSVTIPKGETVWSDAVDFTTEALDALSVSLYFENATYITSAGLSNARTFLGIRSIFRDEVSQCYSANIASPREVNISSSTITYHTTPFLAAVDAYVKDGNASAAVFIGDSTLVNDTYLYFSQKLVTAGVTNVSVVNEAVVANKLLSDGTGIIGNLYGKALVDRFERDALNISGVKYIFVKIGLNDILHQFSKSMGADVPHPTAAEIIEGYKLLVEKAHAKGIKIYFFTKTPWKGYERAFLGQTGDVVWTKEMQNMCDELDKWIKTNTLADGYIDCWSLANPADPYALCPSFTPDGAHLTRLASIALADLIPVSYVGVNKSGIKTAAKINSVNPYKEKAQIREELENPKKPEATTTPEATTKPETTTKPEATTTPENTTQAVTEAPSTTVPMYNGQVTVPDINNGYDKVTEHYLGNLGITPDYNIKEDLPTTVGGGSGILFVLILFGVISVTGAIVFMHLARKKEEEF